MAIYTNKVGIPQYTPNDKPVALNDIIDITKYNKLKQEIKSKLEEGVIDKSQATFLTLAATRHIKFKYDRIADYYCNVASAEMQQLMERSALVLLDVNDAVKNEFTMGRAFIEMLKQNSLGQREEPAEYGKLPEE